MTSCLDLPFYKHLLGTWHKTKVFKFILMIKKGSCAWDITVRKS